MDRAQSDRHYSQRDEYRSSSPRGHAASSSWSSARPHEDVRHDDFHAETSTHRHRPDSDNNRRWNSEDRSSQSRNRDGGDRSPHQGDYHRSSAGRDGAGASRSPGRSTRARDDYPDSSKRARSPPHGNRDITRNGDSFPPEDEGGWGSSIKRTRHSSPGAEQFFSKDRPHSDRDRRDREVDHHGDQMRDRGRGHERDLERHMPQDRERSRERDVARPRDQDRGQEPRRDFDRPREDRAYSRDGEKDRDRDRQSAFEREPAGRSSDRERGDAYNRTGSTSREDGNNRDRWNDSSHTSRTSSDPFYSKREYDRTSSNSSLDSDSGGAPSSDNARTNMGTTYGRGGAKNPNAVPLGGPLRILRSSASAESVESSRVESQSPHRDRKMSPQPQRSHAQESRGDVRSRSDEPHSRPESSAGYDRRDSHRSKDRDQRSSGDSSWGRDGDSQGWSNSVSKSDTFFSSSSIKSRDQSTSGRDYRSDNSRRSPRDHRHESSSSSSSDHAPTPRLPPNWIEYFTKEGKAYYYNSLTKTTQWEFPTKE